MSFFSDNQLARLIEVLTVCRDFDMKSVILSPTKLCAAREDMSSIIVQEFAEPLFAGAEGYRIAITRVPVFLQRLQLVLGNNPVITLDPKDDKQYYIKMGVATDTHNFDFRFGDPIFLKENVPSGIKRNPIHELTITDAQVKQIIDASKAFAPEHVWLHVMPTGTSVQMIDTTTGDRLSIQLSKKEDIKSSIQLKYATPVIIKLLNQKVPVVHATMHANGLLQVGYKGVDVYALRRES